MSVAIVALTAGLIAGPGRALAASAEHYPARAVRFIVPYPPGGSTDNVARVLGQKLQEGLGQAFVIDNRPGAGVSRNARNS